MFTIIGINLLLELAHGKTEDYLLHSLQARKYSLEKNIFLDYVFQVERALLDNSFSKIYELQQNSPSSLYNDVMIELVERLRLSLAKDISKNSKSITFLSLIKILHLESKEDAKKIIDLLNWTILDDQTIKFENLILNNNQINNLNKLDNIITSALRFNSLL